MSTAPFPPVVPGTGPFFDDNKRSVGRWPGIGPHDPCASLPSPAAFRPHPGPFAHQPEQQAPGTALHRHRVAGGEAEVPEPLPAQPDKGALLLPPPQIADRQPPLHRLFRVHIYSPLIQTGRGSTTVKPARGLGYRGKSKAHGRPLLDLHTRSKLRNFLIVRGRTYASSRQPEPNQGSSRLPRKTVPFLRCRVCCCMRRAASAQT